jgi:hypothetical protein
MWLAAELTPDRKGRLTDGWSWLVDIITDLMKWVTVPFYESFKAWISNFSGYARKIWWSISKVLSSVTPLKWWRNLFKSDIAWALSWGKK